VGKHGWSVGFGGLAAIFLDQPADVIAAFAGAFACIRRAARRACLDVTEDEISAGHLAVPDPTSRDRALLTILLSSICQRRPQFHQRRPRVPNGCRLVAAEAMGGAFHVRYRTF
jgi:hypothetical protein